MVQLVLASGATLRIETAHWMRPWCLLSLRICSDEHRRERNLDGHAGLEFARENRGTIYASALLQSRITSLPDPG
jgi:hypothetical protein